MDKIYYIQLKIRGENEAETKKTLTNLCASISHNEEIIRYDVKEIKAWDWYGEYRKESEVF
ncbi:MAG: hypothetical protein KAX49_03700 [Halanaerobiales bacterium]|nr:hypothetical protein [Halanaerobiales bacterium]